MSTTPGPWLTNHHPGRTGTTTVMREDGHAIATCYKPEDALLVAAAPDLLDALRYLIQDQPGTLSFEKWWGIRVQAAREAIAKATTIP